MKQENSLNLSMLILRFVLGVIFMAHGAQKLFGMFNGIGLEGTARMIEGLGINKNVHFFALLWAYTEFIGGIFVMLGILARWSAGALGIIVLTRLWKISLVYGFFVKGGGIEYDILILGACIPIILMGGGSWSVWD